MRVNRADKRFLLNDCERKCQRVTARHERAEFINFYELIKTSQGECAFGRNGK